MRGGERRGGGIHQLVCIRAAMHTQTTVGQRGSANGKVLWMPCAVSRVREMVLSAIACVGLLELSTVCMYR